MVHLDEIPITTFKEMSAGAVDAILDMVIYMKDNGICPVCFCHLLSEAAKDVAKVLEKRENHATTH